MEGRELYNKLLTHPESVTWADFFSDFYRRHSKAEMDRTISAGSPNEPKNRDYLLRAWQKPWLFFQVLKYGLVCCGIMYVILYLIINYVGAITVPAINAFAIFTMPLLFPIVVLLFFWELNLPRNITLLKLIGIFLAGGFLSIAAGVILFDSADARMSSAAFAPFFEEPAKLVAAVSLLMMLNKKPGFQICGLTGLVVGAAVGAGFGGFESAQYAIKINNVFHPEFFVYINEDILIYLFRSELSRGIWAVAGHTLFCAPYAAALALHMEDGKITGKSFWNKDFGCAFAVSFISHFIWNGICTLPVFIVITVVLWISTLGVVKKCFIQFLQGQESVSSGVYFLRGTAGPFADRELQIRQTVLVGRKGECGICLPSQTPGVSGIHCRIVYQENQLYITDAGSTYGTYVNNVRIQPKAYQKLKDGDQVMLGSRAVAFVVCQR